MQDQAKSLLTVQFKMYIYAYSAPAYITLVLAFWIESR